MYESCHVHFFKSHSHATLTLATMPAGQYLSGNKVADCGQHFWQSCCHSDVSPDCVFTRHLPQWRIGFISQPFRVFESPKLYKVVDLQLLLFLLLLVTILTPDIDVLTKLAYFNISNRFFFLNTNGTATYVDWQHSNTDSHVFFILCEKWLIWLQLTESVCENSAPLMSVLYCHPMVKRSTPKMIRL